MDIKEIRRLLEFLKSSEPSLRREASAALDQLGPAAAPAVSLLTSALDDRSCTVRRKAAEMLGRMGPAAGQAVPALTEALRDPIHTVRDAARCALQKIRKGR